MDYSLEEKSFNFLDEDDNLIICPFLFTDKNVNGDLHKVENYSNFLIKIMHKENVLENEILQAFVTKERCKKRIGWIIPVSALISEEHDFAQDSHFGYYAFYIYVFFLSQESIQKKLKDGNDFKTVINELYIEGSDSVIFICEKSNIPELNSLDCFDISLYKYGYYKKFYRLNPYHDSFNGSKKITLEKISDVFFDNDKYDNPDIEFFVNEMYFEKNQKLRFFILYQLIEILIDDIMINQLEKQLENFKKSKVSTRELDKLIKTKTELSRIEKMMELSKISPDKYSELNDSCNTYLKSKGQIEFKFPESLYKFRNMVIHRFRSVINDDKEFEIVNNLMELFLFDVLINYHREFVIERNNEPHESVGNNAS